jgi:LL-diaminopimelate aminotransferase
MSDSFIQNLFAERIGGSNYGKTTAIYKFEKIKRAKRAARAAKPDVPLIDMGVGEPDEMAPAPVVEKLYDAARRPENRGYADNGDSALKESAARYLKNACGVSLDPETQVIHSIGSKAALSILPAAFINPGDMVLMTVPGYPVFGTHAKYYGGTVHNLKLTRENSFLPSLSEIPADVLKKAKVLVLNYPNNPTGASATPAFFDEVVAFARKNNIIVIHDFAYASLVYEGKPLSFLATPGAMDVGIELHSTSKNFNMTGWRCGFVAGNPLIVRAYGDVKDNSDSGQFLAIQHAAAFALDHPEFTADIAAKYSRRMDLLVPVLQRLGFQAEKPAAGFFIYVPAPRTASRDDRTTAFANAEEFSQWMITENLISTVPWDDAGAYVRFSVTFEAQGQEAEKKIIGEIERRLTPYRFEF